MLSSNRKSPGQEGREFRDGAEISISSARVSVDKQKQDLMPLMVIDVIKGSIGAEGVARWEAVRAAARGRG